MKKTFLPVLVLLFLFSVLFWPASVFGLDPNDVTQNPIGVLPDTGENPGSGGRLGDVGALNADNVVEMIMRVVNWFAWFIAVVSVVMGLYSGMLFITARGNTSQLETARQILIYAVIGIIVAIISFSIVTITETFIIA